MTRVLLYSSGLDSYCAAWLWRPDLCLYVDLGTGYNAPEIRLLGHAPAATRTTSLDLSPWERPEDRIIPLRNLMLACVAAQYGETIAMAATAGDRVLDKTPTFASMTSHLLTWLWQPQHWTEGKTVDLVLPVKHLSKSELVRAALDAGADPADIGSRTWSCYTPTAEGTECGACKPCARKWVALVANGCPPTADAADHVRRHYLPAIRDGSWDRGPAEAEDVITALRRAGRLT
ncbi:7-cyano-7-deazaguanine synthase [Marinactinospora rubrisoli]|uniref:7-cyano-7-deazaguanine synthase n=1 Tax=Marinactinospora rubrisoli TaxID=2715399 RepID=A0ABW2KHT8_9ACTN